MQSAQFIPTETIALLFVPVRAKELPMSLIILWKQQHAQLWEELGK